jgi:N-acetylglucosaminyldiphosphoundecaprenol N-acetyl-beta-D-mannosaminyltransferase
MLNHEGGPSPVTVAILGVPVRAQRFAAAVDELLGAVVARRRIRAHFATVHSLVAASRDAVLMEVFKSAEMVCADGMPLVWVSRLRGAPAERVCGPDMMLALADRGRDIGLRHFFLGGAPGTPNALAHELDRRFPGLAVAGGYVPPFGPLSELSGPELVERINAAHPDVVWVGLGAPKQELWAAEHRDSINAPLLLPVGAAFDFHSGRRRRAPRWLQRLGLDWAFSLASEPRRLGPRYWTTNVRFLWLVARETFRRARPSGHRLE